jgi:Trypsin-like peptidase domain
MSQQEKQEIEKIIKPNKDRTINIFTMDKKEHYLEDSTLRPIQDMDLAIFEFVSDDKYEISKFSEQIQLKESVYLFGYKGCYDILKKSDEFNNGEILSSSIKTDSQTERKPNEYDTYYTNAAIKGMSGSPLLNKNGEVIAIHGWAGKNKSKIEDSMLQDCGDLTDMFQNKWGISVKRFISYLELK